ncbi:GldM family protein [Olleya sp. HaHaR_3_96]|uniref:GldM family protein n=1 Tax=Olleya sp. HaHaR_3_96 TaxID=2745560 RepID=UPI001C4FDB8C|nr:GldM family protein [Olleya sp. HaHaR_3_96]QXP60886.1 hypothetical protein H0I26_04410 [Olleya sp. HaHaR_3_96]
MKFTSTVLLILWCSISSVLKNNYIIAIASPKIEIVSTFNDQDIVYRGILNPIHITIENNLPYQAVGEGLIKIDDLGNYKLAPRTGKKITITVTGKALNGTPFTTSKTFEIRNISSGISQFNGKHCKKCELKLTRKELSKGVVSYNFPELLIDGLQTEIISFKIKLPGRPTKKVIGNKIKSSVLITDILKAKRGSQIQLFEIQIKSNLPARVCKVSPIIIRLID